MYQLNTKRVTLDLDGPSVDVEPVRSWAIAYEFSHLLGLFESAEGEAKYSAMAAACEFFVLEAQPTWDFADHRGRIPATGRGMLRLPEETKGDIFNQWIVTLTAKEEPAPVPEGLDVVQSDAPTAVDALLPPGPLNRQIKRKLRAVKAA